MSKHRVQIDMTDKEIRHLDNLGNLLGSVSRAETIRRAVRALLILDQGKGRGKEVLVL